MFIKKWKEVLGSGGKYYVSNTGQVISTTMRVNSPGGYRVRKGKLLHPKSIPKGYRMVDLSIDGNNTRYYVHRLVWEAFNGKIPDGLVINHLDGVPGHDWLSNLEVCTQKENCNYGDHNKKLSESLTMPVEEMVRRVHEIWPTLDYISGFKNANVNCLFKCRVCGAVTSIRPSNIFSNHMGCTPCSNRRLGDLKRHSVKDAQNIMDKIYKGNITVLPKDFNGTDDKCNFKCNTCGSLFNRLFGNEKTLGGNGCSICNKKSREMYIDNIEEARERINNKYKGNITLLSDEIKDAYSTLKFKCNVCGNEFSRKYYDELKRGSATGCAKCNKVAGYNKRFARVKEKLNDRFNGNIVFTDTQYAGSHELSHFKCLACGAEFTKTYHAESTLSGNGHPKCPNK